MTSKIINGHTREFNTIIADIKKYHQQAIAATTAYNAAIKELNELNDINKFTRLS